MSSASTKWLTGCGIGCGALTLIVVGITTAGYMYVKSHLRSFQQAEATTTALRAKYGRVPDFCPEPDGRIRPERMKTFLSVRETLAPARKELESSLSNLSEDVRATQKGRDSFPEIVGLIGQGFGILPRLGEFQARRAEALRDAGMSPGEYVYLYIVSYYSFLSKSPSDGPQFETGERDHIRIRRGEEHDDRDAHALRGIRDVVLPMLRNQRAARQKGLAETVEDRWTSALDAEIRGLESGDIHIPWSRELPGPLKDSLEPYRDELERTYDPLVALELEFWDHGEMR